MMKIRLAHITSLEFLLTVVIFSCLLLPNIIYIGEVAVSLHVFLVFLFFPLILFYLMKIRINRYNVYYLIFLFLVVISTLWGYVALGVPFSWRDVNEIVRYLIPLLAMLLVNCTKSEKMLRYMYLFFLFSVPLIFLISVIEYFNLFNLAPLVGKLYTSDLHVRNMIDYSHRCFVTGGDPNIGAFIVLLYLFFFYYFYLSQKKILSLIVFFLLMIVVLMTSSRTAFFSMAAVMLFSVFHNRAYSFTLRLCLLLLGILVILLILPRFYYLYEGIRTFFSGTNTSFNTRLHMWEDELKIFKQSLWIGWGPAKAIHTTIVDGEYVLLLRRYGIVGFISLLVFIYKVPLKLLRWELPPDAPSHLQILFSAFRLYSGVIPFLMFTNNFFFGYQLFLPYAVFSAVLYNYVSHEKSVSYYNGTQSH